MTPLEFEEMFISLMWDWDMNAEGEEWMPTLEGGKARKAGKPRPQPKEGEPK